MKTYKLFNTVRPAEVKDYLIESAEAYPDEERLTPKIQATAHHAQFYRDALAGEDIGVYVSGPAYVACDLLKTWQGIRSYLHATGKTPGRLTLYHPNGSEGYWEQSF